MMGERNAPAGLTQLRGGVGVGILLMILARDW
jgi:hypothetical protein